MKRKYILDMKKAIYIFMHFYMYLFSSVFLHYAYVMFFSKWVLVNGLSF